jgi:hypothetical protein
LGIYGGDWALGIQGSAYTVSNSSVSPIINQWQHIKLEMINGTATLYVDGTQVAQKTYTSYTVPIDFYLGKANSVVHESNCVISNYEVYKNSNLIQHYKFDEGTGTTLTDYAGSNDGTIYGASWVGTNYSETGNRISPPIDLSGISFVSSSTISWNEILNSQTIDIETSVDNKATWQTATNGGSIADIQGADTLDVRQTLSTTDTTVTPVLDSLNIIIEEGYYITGTVEEDGVFVERTVRLYKRSTGELVDEGISDSVDGGFSFIIPDQTEHYVVALDDISDATDYNALIYDRVIPVAG